MIVDDTIVFKIENNTAPYVEQEMIVKLSELDDIGAFQYRTENGFFESQINSRAAGWNFSEKTAAGLYHNHYRRCYL